MSSSGVPHKGWTCIDVIDLRADGEQPEETDYATCQMCGNEKIRYVHVMQHPDYIAELEVGCVCAEKDDLMIMWAPSGGRQSCVIVQRDELLAETHLASSAKGNSFLNLEGYNLVVYPTKTDRWGYKIGNRPGPRTYPTVTCQACAIR